MRYSLLLLSFLIGFQTIYSQCSVVPPVPLDACYNTTVTDDSYCCNFGWDGLCQSAYDNCVASGGNGGGGGGGGGNGVGCNTDVSICTSGIAGPFVFDQATPGPPTDFANPTLCSTGLFGNNFGFGFIILNITTSGPLNLLVDGNASTGFIDVVVYNIPSGQDPCIAVMNSANEIGCNYATAAVGCTQFGNDFGCTSSLPAPFVNAGDQIMIIVHDYSTASTSFTMNLGPTGAQTGLPNGTVNPSGPFCTSDAPIQLTAVDMGGTWSGPGTSSSGIFTPSSAGLGTHTINYSIGAAPCQSSGTTNISVVAAPIAGTASTPTTAFCGASNVTLALDGSAGSIQWQSAPVTGGPWSNIAGATSANYTAIGVSTNTCFRAMVSGCGSPAYSNTICVTVDIPATVNANIDQTICAGGTVVLAGSFSGGATSATWSAPTGTFSSATNMSATYTPTITSGTVTITLSTNDPSGPCSAVSDQLIVTVNGSISVSAGPDIMICPGTSTTLTATGANSYSWSPGGQTTASITVSPSIATSYTVTGNSSGCTGTDVVNVTIDSPPSATNPSPISVQCSAQVPVPDPLVVLDETDNSGVPTVNFISDLSNGLTCPEIITRTYRIADVCGLFSNVTQTITIDDTTPPTASNPANIFVAGGSVPAPDINVVTNEADNCSTPIVAFVNDVSSGGDCPEIITRTYSVTDLCGNQTFVTQQISIGDGSIPTASNAVSITVECVSDIPAPDPSVITDEADNGALPIVTWEDDTSDGNSCPEIVTRRYRVTDDCGNFIFVSQMITIQDVSAPVFSSVPADITVSCQADIPTNSNLAYTDNCSPDGSVPGIDVSDGNSCPETITRTWTVTDNCGNTSTTSQTIVVHDLITPIISTVPSNLVIDCLNDVPAMVNLGYSDNCDGNGFVSGSDGALIGDACIGTITRTWSISDACGNTSSSSQTITINDDINPTASNPSPISVTNAAAIPAPNPAVVVDEADNCTSSPEVTWISDVSDGNVCNNEQITRTYRITDDCGNSILVAQLITLTAIYPTINAGLDQTVCIDQTTNLNATYSPSSTLISWTTPIQNGVSFNPELGSTTYTLTGDNYGCISSDQVVVTANPLPQPNFVPNNNMGCAPLNVIFTNTSTSISPLVTCVWNMGDGNILNGCGDQNYTYTDSGLFTVNLTVSDNIGCTNSISYTDIIYVESPPEAAFSASTYSLSDLQSTSEIQFFNESIGAENYLWDFGDESSSTDVDPTHTFETEIATNFEVMMVASSPLGCLDTAYRTFIVNEELIYFIPNTFTPDGDEYNNMFQPIFTAGFDPYEYVLLIYDRWGELIFESHDATIGWDGTYGGRLMQGGTYTWKINFKSKQNDKKYSINGHVNLFR